MKHGERSFATLGGIVEAGARPSSDDGASLLEAVRHEDPEVVAWAATRLGMRGDDSALEAIVGLLDHTDANVRMAAATALGLLGSERALGDLRTAATDPDHGVSQAASIALARIGEDGAVDEACKRLKVKLVGGSAEERALAARALGALGPCDSYDALSAALHDADAGVRRDAAASLGQLHDERATTDLASAGFTDADEDVRESAMRALARLVTGGAKGLALNH